jgi:hypothetical protein
MRTITISKAKIKDLVNILFLSLIVINNIFFYVGFSLKPYIILFPVFVLLNIKSLTKKNSFFEIPVIVSIIYIFLSFTVTLWAYDKINHLRLTVALLISVSVFLVLRSLKFDYLFKIIRRVIKCWSFLYFIAIILFIYTVCKYGPLQIRDFWLNNPAGSSRSLIGNSIFSFSYVGHDFMPRFCGFALDPNFNSLYSILLMFASLTYKHKFGLFVGIMSLILTLSRGGLLSLSLSLFGIIIMFLILSVISKYKKMIIKKKYLKFTVVLVLFFSLFAILLSKNFLGFLEKLKGTPDDIRISYVWPSYINLVGNNVFGYGWNYGSNKVGLNTHNTYLSISIGLGIIGLSLYILLIIFYFIKALKKADLLVLFGLLNMIILTISIDVQFEIGLWIFIFLIDFALRRHDINGMPNL